LPWTLSQITETVPKMIYNLSAKPSNGPSISDSTAVEDINLPITYPTPGTPLSIDYAKAVVAAVVGWSIPSTYSNNASNGYTIGEVGVGSTQVRFSVNLLQFLDSSSTTYNLADVVKGLIKNNPPNPQFTSSGYFIKVQDFASTGTTLSMTAFPSSFRTSSGSGTYADISFPDADVPTGFPGKVKVFTGYRAVTGDLANYPFNIADLYLENTNDTSQNPDIYFNSNASTSKDRKTIHLRGAALEEAIQALINRPTLLDLKLLISFSGNNAELTLTNELADESSITDTSYKHFVCTNEILGVLQAANMTIFEEAGIHQLENFGVYEV